MNQLFCQGMLSCGLQFKNCSLALVCSTRLHFHYRIPLSSSFVCQRIQPTFWDATKHHLRKECRNSILMTYHLLRFGKYFSLFEANLPRSRLNQSDTIHDLGDRSLVWNFYVCSTDIISWVIHSWHHTSYRFLQWESNYVKFTEGPSSETQWQIVGARESLMVPRDQNNCLNKNGSEVWNDEYAATSRKVVARKTARDNREER